MPSPFPGMDPYLERPWRDVHTSMVCRACEMLNRVLPPDLAARSDAREYIEEDGRPVRDSEPVTENLVTILELQGERTITVIGIPLAIANFKMIPIALMPFGAEIVRDRPTPAAAV